MTYTTTVKDENGTIVSSEEFTSRGKATRIAKEGTRKYNGSATLGDSEDGVFLTIKIESDGTLGGYDCTGQFIGTVNE